MRSYLRLLTVIIFALVAIVSTVVTGSRAQPATATAGGEGDVHVQAQVRLVAVRGPHEDDVDVVTVTDSYVFTCGYASCSYYISRRGTKAAADYIERHENVVNVAATLTAGGACAATGAGAAVVTVCSGAATAGAAFVMDEIKAAGAQGECLRLHYYFYPALLPAAPSANSSGYCQNG